LDSILEKLNNEEVVPSLYTDQIKSELIRALLSFFPSPTTPNIVSDKISIELLFEKLLITISG
jgi:hypothetical protein